MKALFLDRDGVVNIDYGYVFEIDKFEFTEGIFDFLHLFMLKGYKLFIVTNQSGIGRGYYSQEDFEKLTEFMLATFEKNSIHIEVVEYCNHAPEVYCSCRKPATGMVDNILKKFPIDLKTSWLIGDKQSDIDLALNTGIGRTIALGQRKIENATFAFESLLKCKCFLEKEVHLL